MQLNKIYHGNSLEVLKTFPDSSIDCVVTSPPYWCLRDYGTAPVEFPAMEYSLFGFTVSVEKQTCSLGLEANVNDFIGHMVLIFREVFRVLKGSGTCWINMGDSYAGSSKGGANYPENAKLYLQGTNKGTLAKATVINTVKNVVKPKDMLGVPWMLAFALREDGWYLRQDIIWSKPNPMPESVTDRCTKSHEYIFLLSKSNRYYYDADAIKTKIKSTATTYLKDGTRSLTSWQTGSGAHSAIRHNTKEGSFIEKTKRVVYKEMRDSYGLNGKGFVGHSGNFNSSGNLIGGGKANKRSVWTVATKPFKEAHFATFPEELIVDCIKAGTSEYGCCSHCGEPYIRDFTKELIPTAKASYNSKPDSRDAKADTLDQGSNRIKDGHKPGWVNRTTTKGWVPSCACSADIDKAVVLDPFMGAGATALVARKLNRNFVGVELNQEYIETSEKRLRKQLGMFL